MTDRSNGRFTSCSGVMVAEDSFLTAAHCICGTGINAAKSLSQCLRSTKNKSFKIFLPKTGLLGVSGVPAIHERYGFTSKDTTKPIADLAILRTDRGIQNKLLKIGSRNSTYAATMVGFGFLYFTVQETLQKVGFPSGYHMQSGISQVSKYRNTFYGKETCDKVSRPDTLCTIFSGLTFPGGPMQDATVCKGDSGAPLFQNYGEGPWSLIGIASFFSPENEFDQCLADSVVPKRNHFVDVTMYVDWIARQIAVQKRHTSEIKNGIQTCIDGIFRDSTIDLIGFSGTISISAFQKYERSDEQRPSISISLPDSACEKDVVSGVAFCHVEAPTFVSTSVKEGFGQWTICNR